MLQTRIAVGALLVASALSVYGQPGVIDDERLLHTDTDRANWLTHGRDYSNQRFSPLAQNLIAFIHAEARQRVGSPPP